MTFLPSSHPYPDIPMSEREEVISPVERKKLGEKRAARCVHFTGIQNDRCKAGVLYDDVRGEPGHGTLLPCLNDVHMCAQRRYPTPEEVEAELRGIEDSIRFGMEAHRRINEQAKGKRGIAGVVECPKCGGKLHYSIAGNNGHVWGKCATAGCLAWMQ